MVQERVLLFTTSNNNIKIEKMILFGYSLTHGNIQNEKIYGKDLFLRWQKKSDLFLKHTERLNEKNRLFERCLGSFLWLTR